MWVKMQGKQASTAKSMQCHRVGVENVCFVKEDLKPQVCWPFCHCRGAAKQKGDHTCGIGESIKTKE